MKNFFKNYGIYLISSLFFAVIALIFAARYVRGEDSAYLWDCRWYWFQYADYGEMFRRNWQDWIGSIWSLVQTSEYNTFYTVLLLPFYLLLQTGELTPTAIAFDFKSAYKFKQMQIFLFEDEAANPGQKAAEISVKLDGMPVFSGPILPGAAPITINNPFFSVNRLSIRAGNCGKHTRDRIVFAFFR